jgi:carbon monoxide dehydrogenase subunit G
MAMEMDHSFTVPVSPDRAWDVLLDVERIAPCMPGATVEEFDGEVVTGRIKVKVGPVSLTYRGTAKFTERNPDAKNIVLEASGKETRGAGTASATVQAWLEPGSSGEATTVSMHTTMNVTGRPAQFGRGVIVEVGGKLVEQFAQNLRQQIIGDGADAADAAAGTAPAETTPPETAPPAGAATVGDGAEADTSAGPSSVAAADQTGTSTPTVSPLVAATTSASSAAVSAPVASTTSAPSVGTNEDSINLIRLVGPAILKRVVPVAAVVAALTLLGRRLFRRGAKK